MKKKLLMLSFIAAVAITTGWFGKKTLGTGTFSTNLIEANIEALSSGEDDGIDIADCYFNGSSPEMKCVKVCPGETTTDKIFPCPTEERFIFANARGTCYKKK